MVGLRFLEPFILVRVQVPQQKNIVNIFQGTWTRTGAGVGEKRFVSPWRKDWENRGFPRSERSKSRSL